MALKIITLLALTMLVLSPAILGCRFKDITAEELERLSRVREEEQRRRERSRRRRSARWTGPKTDERINRMLAESIALLKKLGVPISDSIAPEVKLTSAHSYYGMCCPRGSRKYCTEYDYYIEISGFTLENTEKSLRNTLIHELIHTVPGGQCHTGEWKKWAKYVSEKTGYKIQRCDGDETAQDKERLGYRSYTHWLEL